MGIINLGMLDCDCSEEDLMDPKDFVKIFNDRGVDSIMVTNGDETYISIGPISLDVFKSILDSV